MNVDRRRNVRKVPNKFAFIQVERDDGGTVLDVSEGGLSFNTFAPVRQDGPIHFWFSLNLNERIEAWGEVAWTDETKKVGGLRFIRLPERASRQIREWISEPVTAQVPDESFPPVAVAGAPPRVAANEQDAVARFVSKAHSQRTLILSRSEESERSNGSLPTLGERAATGELVPLQRYLSEKRRQFRRGVLLGMCISVAIVVPTMKYLSYRHENRGFEKTPAKLADQKGSADALPTATLKASTESSTSADSLGSDNQKKDVAEARRPTILSTETGGHSGPSAPKAPATNPSSRARLQTSSGGNASRQKPTMTPQQLWTSVQAGNTKAAVALAELYIKGEGVPQSCNQARVLLLVASEKRNAEAIKRLHELDKTGCP